MIILLPIIQTVMTIFQQDFMIMVSGVILLLIGLALRFFVGRRRFNRRGVGGLQQYSTYGKALVTTTFESILQLMGLLMILGGIFLCLLYWLNQRAAVQHREKQAIEKKKDS